MPDKKDNIPGWVIFLTIPIYYWIVRVVEDDPNWRASRENRSGKE